MSAVPHSGQFTGVSLGSRHWSACDLGPLGDVRHRLTGPNGYSPPSVLVPRFTGEPIRFDAWYPTHPRGSGRTRPLEAAVQTAGGVGRFPLAAAWSGRRIPDAAWEWDSIPEEPVQVDPVEAVAAACRSVVARYGRTKAAVVIPNDFQQSEQQRALDEINQVHSDTQLLWLPVAAALAWLEGVREEAWPDLRHGRLGEVVIVHCDWGQIQCSRLELRSVERRTAIPVVPARRRPIIADKTIRGFGWALIESGGSLASHWERVFASDSSRPLESLFGEGVAAYQATPQSEWLRRLSGWSVPQQPVAKALEELVGHLEELPSAPSGVVVVGDFANLVAKGLNRFIELGRLRVQQPVAVFGGAAGERLLAHGAAVHLARQAAGEISYYDSLPELELFVDRRGAYEWVSLLGDSEHFVQGGVPWELDEPIVGFELRRGSSQVKLVLAHEEYRGVRELVSSFDESHEQRTPVTLHVSCTPAQGNAKLRLVTSPPLGEESREVLANWHRMVAKTDAQNQPIDKEEYLKSQPRAFPELMPRLSSESKWRAVKRSLERMVELVEQGESSQLMSDRWLLSRIKMQLQQKDQSLAPQDATAVGSDFRCPNASDQSFLNSAAEVMLDLWRSYKDRRHENVNHLVRALGYMSVRSEEFERWLVRPERAYPGDPRAVEHTSGLVLSDPGHIAAFVASIFPSPRSSPTPNRLKAVSQVLRYRSDATSAIDSRKSAEIIEICLRHFESGVSSGGRTFAFRWSSLIIVYMLRRRMFDVEFLDPSSVLAMRAKELFSDAIERCRTRRMRPMAGTVNLPAALEQMIAYIDRKGSGDILMAAEDG